MGKSLTLAVSLLLAGCAESGLDQLEAENAELRSQVADLEAKLSSARSAAEYVARKAAALRASSNELQAQLARFQTEDWRDVVPSASSASEDVESAQDDLETASSELEDAIE